MRKLLLPLLFLLAVTHRANAQADLFGSTQVPARKGFIIGVNGNFDVPGADMAKRFGLSYRLGPSVLYKTEGNWVFGAKCDWLFGNKIKEPGFLSNITDSEGYFVTSQGGRQSVQVFERGWDVGVEVGRIFPLSKNNRQGGTGIIEKTGIGFIQHKITIFDADGVISQIKGDYRKGYDRLTNGIYLEQFLGYNHLDPKGFVNFYIGVNLLCGFTEGRRTYLYDVRRADDQSRIDLLFGIRGGWYVPLFKRKSEEIYFD